MGFKVVRLIGFRQLSRSSLGLSPSSLLSSSSAFQSKFTSFFNKDAKFLQLPQVVTRNLYVEKMKKYKPTTPGFRHRKIVDRSHLWKGRPYLPLTKALRSTGGRNIHGRVTVQGRGGGHKRRYRMIDFKRNKPEKFVVERLEYDPNRTAWIALIKSTESGKFSYILAPKGLDKGDIVENGEILDASIGNCMPLKNIPVGTLLHNIEQYPGRGGQIARSAGNYAQLITTGQSGFATIKMPSKEVRLVSVHCRATVGVVSNTLHNNVVLGKAGASRWKGRRPKVRGVAKNPCDHPHGGGEGKGKGVHPQTPWGFPTNSGYKTRPKSKFSNKYIIS